MPMICPMEPGQHLPAGTHDASAMALAVTPPHDENLTVVAAARARARDLVERGDPDRAVAELALSAEVSEANGDTNGAIEDLSTAIILAPSQYQRIALMLQRGHMAIGVDHPESFAFWQEIAEYAKAEGDARIEARALYHLFRASPSDGRQYLEQAKELDCETIGWAALAGSLLAAIDEDTDEASRCGHAALRLSRIDGDRLVEALALDAIGYQLWFRGELDNAIATLQQAIALLSVRGNPRSLMKTRLNLAEMFLDNLETARAWNVSGDLKRSIDQSSNLPWKSSILAQEAWILTNLGRFIDAVPVAREATETDHSDADSSTGVITWATYAFALLMVGDTGDEFDRALENARMALRKFNLPLYAVEIDLIDLRVALHKSDVNEAIAVSKKLERHRSVDDKATVANHALLLARQAIILDNDDIAQRAAEVIEYAADFDPSTAAKILVALDEARATLAVHAKFDPGALDECIQRWRTADRPYDEACALLTVAIATLRAGKRSTAMDLISDLHGRFASFGSMFEVEECTRLLQELSPGVDHSPMLESQLFAGLSKDERDLIDRNLATATFVRGKRFFDVDDASTTIYFVRRGRVRLTRVGDDSKSLTIAIIDAGGVFGEGALLGLPTAGVYAEAIEDGVVGTIPTNTLRELMHRIPRLGMNMLELVGRRMNRSERLAEEIAYWSVRRRFAHLVLELDDRYGHPTMDGSRIINQNFTQGELAEMVGATRKAVAILIGELRTKNVLDTQGKRLVIMDRDKLEEMVNSDT